MTLSLSTALFSPSDPAAEVLQAACNVPLDMGLKGSAFLSVEQARSIWQAMARVVQAHGNAVDEAAASGRLHPAVAAIQFALTHSAEANAFLNAWSEGDWETLRREWPEAPEDVYMQPVHGEQMTTPAFHSAAVAAIRFARTQGPEVLSFLNSWSQGYWDVLRADWPNAPESIYPKESIQDDRSSWAPVGQACAMPGTNEGFTMVCFNGADVPVGTELYIKKPAVPELVLAPTPAAVPVPAAEAAQESPQAQLIAKLVAHNDAVSRIFLKLRSTLEDAKERIGRHDARGALLLMRELRISFSALPASNEDESVERVIKAIEKEVRKYDMKVAVRSIEAALVLIDSKIALHIKEFE